MNTAQPTLRSRLVPFVTVALTTVFWCVLWSCSLGAIGYLRSGATYLKNYRNPTSAEMRIAMAMDYAERSAEPNDVILVGDATCESVSTRDLERGTGLRAWSLCIVGLVESDGIGVLLSRYLAHHPPPKLLVIVRHPLFMAVSQVGRSPGLARSRYDFLRRFEPGSSERWFSSSETFMVNVKEGWWDLRGLVSEVFGHPMNALVEDCGVVAPSTPDTSYRCPGVPLIEAQEGYQRSRGAEGGALTTEGPARVGPSARVFDAMERVGPSGGGFDATSNPGYCGVAVAGMEAIIHEAADRRIPILIRFSPVTNERGSRADAIEACVQNLVTRNPGVTVAQPYLLRYDRGLFQDVLHVNAPGSRQLTARLIEDVRTMLGSRSGSGASVAPVGPMGN